MIRSTPFIYVVVYTIRISVILRISFHLQNLIFYFKAPIVKHKPKSAISPFDVHGFSILLCCKFYQHPENIGAYSSVFLRKAVSHYIYRYVYSGVQIFMTPSHPPHNPSARPYLLIPVASLSLTSVIFLSSSPVDASTCFPACLLVFPHPILKKVCL